jgi:hypothetical protein
MKLSYIITTGGHQLITTQCERYIGDDKKYLIIIVKRHMG